MNFVNLVHKILTESKPVILPSKVNILIDEIFNWVKSLCDPELWNQNKISFINETGEESKVFYFSNYVDKSHSLYNLNLTVKAPYTSWGAGEQLADANFREHFNTYINIFKKKVQKITFERLKQVIRHEVMHIFDPTFLRQEEVEAASSHRGYRGKSKHKVIFNRNKQETAILPMPDVFKNIIDDFLDKLKHCCDPTEWAKGFIYVNKDVRAKFIDTSRHSRILDLPISPTTLKLLESLKLNNPKIRLTTTVDFYLSNVDKNEKFTSNHLCDNASTYYINNIIEILLPYDLPVEVSERVISIAYVKNIIYLSLQHFMKLPRDLHIARRTKLKDSRPKKSTATNVRPMGGYFTDLTKYGGKIPSEFTPMLDTLLQYFSVEKWRDFLNDINNTTANTENDKHIKKCIKHLTGAIVPEDVANHVLFTELVALFLWLKDPYLKRKTLQKIFWFVNNHTTQ